MYEAEEDDLVEVRLRVREPLPGAGDWETEVSAESSHKVAMGLIELICILDSSPSCNTKEPNFITNIRYTLRSIDGRDPT